MKQYVVTPAYEGNSHVIMVNDGKVERDEIITYYNLEGYTSAVENLGYQKAEPVAMFEKALERAKQAYEDAKNAFEEAKKRPLIITEEDAKKYHLLDTEDFD